MKVLMSWYYYINSFILKVQNFTPRLRIVVARRGWSGTSSLLAHASLVRLAGSKLIESLRSHEEPGTTKWGNAQHL